MLTVTKAGVETLEPYKVKNAIIMAVGMSSRFSPFSYEKTKGLLMVEGEILIEREIKPLYDAGIEDITIVVGYMKEKFNIKVIQTLRCTDSWHEYHNG